MRCPCVGCYIKNKHHINKRLDMKEAVCMKCGSNKIIPNVRVLDRGYSGKSNLQLELVIKKTFFY